MVLQPRVIGHLDMDAFFAAVEERDNVWLSGKPIVVGADPKGGAGRGVVSTANYKAREYGVHSALPISKAWRLCEDARKAGKEKCYFVGGSCGEVSAKIMEILGKYSPVVEQTSVDEAYFEISGSFEEAKKLAKKIKKEIKEKERLSCSIGIGPNKLIAKIASDFKKPDGLTIVKEYEAEKFLEPMVLRKIPGIGPKTENIFLKKGIKIVRDLKKISREEIPYFYDKIRGRDNSPLALESEAKSIGEEETFEKDTKDPILLVGCVNSLAEDIFRGLKSKGFESFRTVVLKIRFANFDTKTRSHTLAKPALDKMTLKKEAIKLLLPFLDKRENPNRRGFRLLGLRIEKLYNK